MTAPIVLDLDAIEAAAKAATPQDFDSAELKVENGHVECPQCGGQGEVELLAEYTNFDGVAIGVQFFGIGHEFGAAEAFYRAANPAVVLELVRRLRIAEQMSEANLLKICAAAGDTLIIRTTDEYMAQESARGLAGTLPIGMRAILISNEMEVSALDVDQMREAGWVREPKKAEGKASVDADALRQVLQALIGPVHHIRELQVCRGLPDSPIDKLMAEFNAQSGGA